MKKVLVVSILILLFDVSAFCGEFENTLKKAEQGNAEAQYILGEMYSNGKGVPQNYKQAVYWYTQAAEQGNEGAQFHLGYMYYYGKEVAQDYKQAVYWYTQAAEQGNEGAQFHLGEMYLNGKGVAQDSKQAVYWYKKSAEQGDMIAQWRLMDMYRDGEYGVARDSKQAFYWYKKSAEQGGTSAEIGLGDMYYYGKGVAQNYKQAFYWYKKSAERGDDFAQYSLGYMYYYGKGVAQDYKQAVYWYTKAAEQGSDQAQFSLGFMYSKGQGVPQDYKQAFYWLKKAAEQGEDNAQGYLGGMYYEGQVVAQNFKLAYVWTSLAAAQGNEGAIKNRDMVIKFLTPQQLVEAQDLAAKIQYQIDHPTKTQENQAAIGNTEKKINGSGTGFIITKDGYILTCHHVIKDANEIKIVVGGNTYSAKLVRDDPNNDLALLKINGSFEAIAFSSKRSAKMGQEVFTIGYPNPSLQGVNAKITKGIVNSLTGFQDDLRLYQISVPVQPGNSGGALMDENGNILGIIVAMLDAKTTFKISGSLPQNVNYAVKSIYAQAMLDTLPEIYNKLISPSKNKSDTIENVKKSTVMVICYD